MNIFSLYPLISLMFPQYPCYLTSMACQQVLHWQSIVLSIIQYPFLIGADSRNRTDITDLEGQYSTFELYPLLMVEYQGNDPCCCPRCKRGDHPMQSRTPFYKFWHASEESNPGLLGWSQPCSHYTRGT